MVGHYLVLLLVLAGVGAALFLGVSFMMARILLSPRRMVGGVALAILGRLGPEDLGLPFEEMSFRVLDEQRRGSKLMLLGWWIPAAVPSDRCVVIVHGYADSRIGALAWAPTFRAMGYNVLAADLRAHGESEGTQTTAGFFERHDLSQVIDQLRAARPEETREVVLFGVSLGAAVAGATAAMRDDVAAVIMDCPYNHYATAAQTHSRVMGMPGPWFQRLAIALAQKLSGADFDAVAPVNVIPTLACPLMVIHGADDLFVDPVDMDDVERATNSRAPELGPTVYWRADRTHHVLAVRTDPAEFRRRIEGFLSVAIRAGERPAASVAPR